eukprot:2660336-Amphidinium_carterae.2
MMLQQRAAAADVTESPLHLLVHSNRCCDLGPWQTILSDMVELCSRGLKCKRKLLSMENNAPALCVRLIFLWLSLLVPLRG